MNLNKKIILKKESISYYIKSVFKLNYQLSQFLKKDNVTGFEKNLTIGLVSENSGIINPLLWGIGHYCYFYEYHFFKYYIKDYKFFIDNGDLYDSFLTSREYRFKFRPHSKKKIFEYLKYVEKTLNYILEHNKLDEQLTYFFLLTILHNHMHCESAIFTKKLLGYQSIFNFNYNFNNNKLKMEIIKIPEGKFLQGTVEGENLIAFDNEKPQFKTQINSFYVTKYCITEKNILDFINDGGYKEKKWWNLNGWRWILDNSISLPFYWIHHDDEYFIKDNNKIRKLIHNLPACHISWYEADAIARWMGGRLPTESEWEYMSTNYGKTIYPWGNKMKKQIGNLNYSGNICDVSLYPDGDNYDGVRQLIGNVWEWCSGPFYPYDGFKIDPIYRELSYPFFGFKKILRGGCWAVPDILINSRYRNAQMPDTQIQLTGFRVVFDSI